MKKLACLLVVFSLGLFVVGCGGKDEKKEEKKESEKKEPEAGKGVKVEGGEKKEIDDPTSILGGDKKDATDGDDKVDPAGGGGKDSTDDKNETELKVPGPEINPPVIDPPAIDKKEGGEAADTTEN